MKLKISKSWLFEILLIFLLSLTPLLWFRQGAMLVSHDNIFPFDPIAFFKNRLYTWSQTNGFGQDQSLIIGTIPIHFIDALPKILGFSLVTTQKLVYLFWFFMIGLSIYVLVRLLWPEKLFVKILAVVLYQYNFYLLNAWFIGERTKFSAYIAIPLVLAVFFLVYWRRWSVLRGAAANFLILFCFCGGGIMGLPLLGGIIISLAVFIIFFSLINYWQKQYRQIGRIWLLAVVTGLGFVLVNAYFFWPAISKAIGGYQGLIEEGGGVDRFIAWAQMISIGSSFLNLLRLQGISEWYGNTDHPYAFLFLSKPILVIASFIFPILVLLSLFFIKRKKDQPVIFYLFTVYLTSIFFAAGTHPPFGTIYVAMMKIIPGFALFRTPYYKFASTLMLSNSLLVAFSLDYLIEKFGFFSRRWLRAIIALGVIVLILTYHFPYFTGVFFNWKKGFSTRLKLPDYIFSFQDWVNNQKKDDLRILLVPAADSAWGFDIYSWGYLSHWPMPRLLTNQPIFAGGEGFAAKEDEQKLKVLYQSLLLGDKTVFPKLASILRIGYILVRQDFAYNLDWTKTTSPDTFKAQIENTFSYPKEKTFGPWSLYRINYDQPILAEAFALDEWVFLSNFDHYQQLLSQDFLIPEKTVVVSKSFVGSERVINRGALVECLSCQIEKESDFVIFPHVSLLPDSPFYFLVKLKEKNLIDINNPPEKNIYDTIGLSLKRTGELRETFIIEPPKSPEALLRVVENYRQALIRLRENFAKITDSDKKLIISEKLKVYLKAERDELSRTYDEIHMTEDIKKIFEQAIWELDVTAAELSPYLFNRDFATSKLYSIAISKDGNYRISINKADLGLAIDKGTLISVQINSGPLLETTIGEGSTINLGEHYLAAGQHHVLLSLPPPADQLVDGEMVKKNFVQGEKNCYVYKIANFSPTEIYQFKFEYKNTLHEDLFYFVGKKTSKGEKTGFFKPNDVVKLSLRAKNSQQRYLILPDEQAEFAQIGFCASDLDLNNLNQIIHQIEAKRLIKPLLILKSLELEDHNLQPQVEVEKINPVKYKIKTSGATGPFFLVFLQKYSSDWELIPKQEILSHFSVYGYANGWLIDSQAGGEYQLTYRPQKVFYLGAVISAIVLVLVGLIFFIKRK